MKKIIEFLIFDYIEFKNWDFSENYIIKCWDIIFDLKYFLFEKYDKKIDLEIFVLYLMFEILNKDFDKIDK
jgi:hypothetical protein